MHRTIALSLALVAPLAGCRDTTVNPIRDLSMPPAPDLSLADLAGADLSGGDMAIPLNDLSGAAMDVTINQLDTGLSPQFSQLLHLTNVVVVGFANGSGHSKTTMKCEYVAYVQDPAGPAPSGIELFATGDMCTPQDSGQCFCPFTPNSNTLMDPIGTQANVGDVVDVYGWIDNYTPSSDAGLQPTQHELSLTTKYGTGMIVKANMNTPIVPTVITDGTQFALNTGAGFTNNEDMLVTIKPAAAAAITMPNNFGEFLYSSASIGGFYRFTYSKANDGGTFPVTGDTFTSITGVATPAFGGHIAPRGQADFIR